MHGSRLWTGGVSVLVSIGGLVIGGCTADVISARRHLAGKAETNQQQQPTDPALASAARQAIENKICLTIGDRQYGPADRCEADVDRQTFVAPLIEVFDKAPPILKAYMCSLDRIYLDYHLTWNANFEVKRDEQTAAQHRSIGIRRGFLEKHNGLGVDYNDWMSGWTQHWWTGEAHDERSNDPQLPWVESNLDGPMGIIYQMTAHECAHVVDEDYTTTFGRDPESKAFEPGEFGAFSFATPRYSQTDDEIVGAVGRDATFQPMRALLDFEGNIAARDRMAEEAAAEQSIWEAGSVRIKDWSPRPRSEALPFIRALHKTNFTTVFSVWRPADDWTDSFMMMMMPAITSKLDFVTAKGERYSLLDKVKRKGSPFASKRAFIQRVIDRALADFRDTQARAVSPDACMNWALASAK